MKVDSHVYKKITGARKKKKKKKEKRRRKEEANLVLVMGLVLL